MQSYNVKKDNKATWARDVIPAMRMKEDTHLFHLRGGHCAEQTEQWARWHRRWLDWSLKQSGTEETDRSSIRDNQVWE